MIITEKKKKEEVLGALAGSKKVYLFGCGSCAEQCQTGGKKELDEMADFLNKKGFKVTGSSMVDETCYRQLVLKEFKHKKEIKGSDSILVLACGAGVKTVADIAEETQPVLAALDSIFLASVERYGRFFEGCSLCGECLLSDTAGICPHTDCPKGLLNGPCGGVVDGQCEVDTENACAWVRIYKRLKGQNRLHLMKKKRPLKDYSKAVRPRSRLLRNPGGSTGLERK
ncbi:MAG: methylenetetrahydrofolate reductase C-terminal domain-containing protein [Thermodesulfobacteriota bacterium]